MPEQPAVLIAAVSGRALAASARRGGFVPLVADGFGDDDTLALAHAYLRVQMDAAHRLDPEHLLQALERLAVSHRLLGMVCGTGFEDRPALLDRIARQWRLLGNSPATIARLKHPQTFAALCRGCGVSHPETRADPPTDLADWLVKRAGGAGGTHVRSAMGGAEPRGTAYYQRRVTGTPISALVLGNGRALMVLGFSAQWAAPAAGEPFRYGGAVRPANLSAEMSSALVDAVKRFGGEVPLIGLNSFDFMVDEDAFCLLEINPRPGATLEIFEPSEDSLFALHVAACKGALPSKAPELPEATAGCIVYSDRDIRSVPAM